MTLPVRRGVVRALPVRCLAIAILTFCAAGEGFRAQTLKSTGAGSAGDTDLILTLGAGATSNAEFAAAGGPRGGDYLSNLGLDFMTVRSTERTDWSLHYRPFYSRYQRRSELSALNHSLDFTGGYDLSRRTRLILSDNFGYSRNPLYVARYEVGDSPVLTRESKRWSNSSSAGVDMGLSRSLTLQFGLSGTAYRFQETGLYDSNVYTGSAGFSKKVGRNETFSTTYSYSRFLLSAPELPDLNTTSQGLRVGWSHAPGEGSKMGVSVGGSRVAGEAGVQTLFTGDAFFQHSFRAGDFSAGYRQELTADTGFAAVNLARVMHAGFSGQAGRSFRWGLVGDYGTRESRVVTGNQFDSGSVVDLQYADVVLRGDFALSPRWGLRGSAISRRQDDVGNPDSKITVNSLFLGMTYRIF